MTNTLQRIYEEVVQLTNRPDLVQETNYAIRAITVKAHNFDEFTPDKVVVIVTPTKSSDSNIHSCDLQAEPFVRVRKVLQVTDYPTTKEFVETDVTCIFDEFGRTAVNTFYRAGTSLNIRASDLDLCRVTYLQRPDTNSDTYCSWIAEEYTTTIVQGAVSMLFDVIGKREESAKFGNFFVASLRDLQANFIEA